MRPPPPGRSVANKKVSAKSKASPAAVVKHASPPRRSSASTSLTPVTARRLSSKRPVMAQPVEPHVEDAGQSSTPVPATKPTPTARMSVPSKPAIAVKQEFVHKEFGKAPPITSGPALKMSRAALRAKFMRSRNLRGDPRNVSSQDTKQSLERIPDEVAAKIVSQDDEEYWLQYWAAHDCSWGKATASYEKSRDHYEDGSAVFAWMNFSQMVDCYKDVPVAERQRDICLRDPEHWYIPQGFEDVPSAQQFWAPRTIEVAYGTRVSNKSSVKVEAAVGAEAANLMMNRNNVVGLGDVRKPSRRPPPGRLAIADSRLGVGATPPVEEKIAKDALQAAKDVDAQSALKAAEDKAAEDKAAEDAKSLENAAKTAEGAKAKEEAKIKLDAQKEKLKKEPKYQAGVWLKGAAMLIMQCGTHAALAKKAKLLPAGTHLVYHQKFTVHYDTLKCFEDEVRELMTSRSKLKQKLMEANDYVMIVKQDAKAFNILHRGYYGKDSI